MVNLHGNTNALHRGDIWWVDFGTPQGSEPGFQRPAVIVTSDRINASHISTVTVVPLTTNMKLAAAAGNVELTRQTGGLPKDCVANVSQVTTVNRYQCIEKIGSLPLREIFELGKGLRLLLDL